MISNGVREAFGLGRAGVGRWAGGAATVDLGGGGGGQARPDGRAHMCA
jgi:hypothetical protein